MPPAARWARKHGLNWEQFPSVHQGAWILVRDYAAVCAIQAGLLAPKSISDVTNKAWDFSNSNAESPVLQLAMVLILKYEHACRGEIMIGKSFSLWAHNFFLLQVLLRYHGFKGEERSAGRQFFGCLWVCVHVMWAEAVTVFSVETF